MSAIACSLIAHALHGGDDSPLSVSFFRIMDGLLRRPPLSELSVRSDIRAVRRRARRSRPEVASVTKRHPGEFLTVATSGAGGPGQIEPALVREAAEEAGKDDVGACGEEPLGD